jgi:hypothetical protein
VPVGDCAPRRQFGPTLGTDGLGPTWLTTNSVSAETAIPAVPPKPNGGARCCGPDGCGPADCGGYWGS